jgi:AAA domain
MTHAKIRRPSQSTRLPRLLVYARPKKGKTLLTSTAGQGHILILDPENGTDWMKSPKLDPHVWEIEKWEDIVEAQRFIAESNHDYDWVGVDGLTRITQLSLRWVLKQKALREIDQRPGMIMLKDRGRAGELVSALLYKIHNQRDMGVIFTAQERIVSDDEGGGDTEDEDSEAESKLRYVPDLPKGVRSSVTSLVDVIGRLYVVPDPDNEGKKERRLWVEPHSSYDTGYRSSFILPPYIRKPSIPRIVRALEKGRIENE